MHDAISYSGYGAIKIYPLSTPGVINGGNLLKDVKYKL